MRILFDQGTPVGIRQALAGHIVKTAYEMAWSTLSNGELLRAAEETGFEVFVTTDKNLVHQQNLTHRRIAIVVLSQSRWTSIKSMLNDVIDKIEQALPGTHTYIEIAR